MPKLQTWKGDIIADWRHGGNWSDLSVFSGPGGVPMTLL